MAITIEEGTSEFTILFILTIIVIVIKLSLSTYLFIQICKKYKQKGEINLDILSSVLIFMLTLLISRILLLYFDFILTEFNNTRFHEMPQVILWKIAFVLVNIGLGIFIYTIDKKALEFRFKGLFSFALFLIAIILLLFPVNSQKDFQILETIIIFTSLISIIIPAFFLYLAYISPSQSNLRNLSISIAVGMIIYGVGANIVGENLLVPISTIFGVEAIIILWTISLILKTIGLSILAYGATKIKV